MAALLALGVGLSILGDIADNKAEAQAARESAKWLEEQASYFRGVTEANVDILENETRALRGYTNVVAAANGVSLEGSFGPDDIQTNLLEKIEIEAIRAEGRMQVREATIQAKGLRRKAALATDFHRNLLQGLGTFASSKGGAAVIAGIGSMGKKAKSYGEFRNSPAGRPARRTSHSGVDNIFSIGRKPSIDAYTE